MILGQEIALEVILIWKDDAKEGGSWGQGKVSGGSLNLLRADCPAQIQTHTQSQGSLTTWREGASHTSLDARAPCPAGGLPWKFLNNGWPGSCSLKAVKPERKRGEKTQKYLLQTRIFLGSHFLFFLEWVMGINKHTFLNTRWIILLKK